MASSSSTETKPVRGILKTSKSNNANKGQHHSQLERKERKLPPWMQKSVSKDQVQTPPLSVLKIPSSCNIIYSYNANDCVSICDNLLRNMDGVCYIGFDIEWPVVYSSSNEAQTAVIQICDAPTKRCFVFHISCIGFLPSPLKTIIEREDIIKVGLNIEGDLYKLCRDFDVRFPKQGFLELCNYANDVTKSSEKWSLARLVKFLYGSELPKIDSVRKGDWTVYPLSTAQLEYAALDAIASLMVFNELQRRENRALK